MTFKRQHYTPKKFNNHDEIYLELKKLVKVANERKRKLKKKVDFETQAYKRLISKLTYKEQSFITKNGNISVKKSYSMSEMRQIYKATLTFLNAKTSSLEGLKEVRENQIKGLAKFLSYKNGNKGDLTDEDLKKLNSVSLKESEALLESFGDEDVKIILQYISPSEFWALNDYAIEKNLSENQYIDLFKSHIDFQNDKEMKDRLIRLYERFVN